MRHIACGPCCTQQCHQSCCLHLLPHFSSYERDAHIAHDSMLPFAPDTLRRFLLSLPCDVCVLESPTHLRKSPLRSNPSRTHNSFTTQKILSPSLVNIAISPCLCSDDVFVCVSVVFFEGMVASQKLPSVWTFHRLFTDLVDKYSICRHSPILPLVPNHSTQHPAHISTVILADKCFTDLAHTPYQRSKNGKFIVYLSLISQRYSQVNLLPIA